MNRQKNHINRPKIFLWQFMIALLGIGLLWNPQTAKADVTQVELPEITAPSQVDTLEDQDIGAILQLGSLNTYYYFTFSLQESGWVFFDYSGTGYPYLYSNASMTKEITRNSYGTKSGGGFYHRDYYLEPGVYYLKTHSLTTVFGYFLPTSKVLTLKSTLAPDKTYATVTAECPAITPSKLDWTADTIAYSDMKTASTWKNSSLVNSFTAEDNGTYSVRITSTSEEWKDYPLMLRITVSDIAKCEHVFSTYESTAEGHFKKCAKCGKYETETPAKHTPDGGTVTKEPTTLENGSRVYTCTECGAIIKEDVIPKKESHDYLTVLTHEATNSQYRVITTAAQGTPAVEYYKPLSKKIGSLKIPATVSIEGVTYQVTKVGVGALKGCTSLKSLTVGANVTTIDKQAFYGCKKLKTITVSSKNLTTVGKNAIKNIAAKATIKVPKSKKYSYKYLFTSKTGFKRTMKIK